MLNLWRLLWLALAAMIAAGLGAAPARAQALFPGGCPVVFDAFGGATVTYSFSAGSSGTFTDAGGAVCNGMGQPSPWRYRYTYTVTSTLVDATFRITSPHEGGVDITAPGTYEVTARVFPGNQWEARTYGAHPDNGAEPYDEDVFGPLSYPALGLGYSTTATGPNPSGTVTVTFRGLTTDVPGSRVVFSTTPGPLLPAAIPNRGPLIAATGTLRSGDRPFEIAINAFVTFEANLSLLLQTGATYGFTVNPYHGGLLHSVTCSAGSATIGADNASFTLTGQADRSQVNCTLAHAQRPTVTALSTASGPAAGGTVVTITGSDFTGVSAVRFGGTAATAFTVNSATQITATAPAGTGAANVSVVIGSLASTDTAADDFAYLPAPTVTGLSPTSGARTGGTSVVVTGANLTGATGVTFGGVAATAFTVDSATQITATAPAGAANGPVDVQVTAPGGVSANTAADDFTYTGPVVQGLFQAGCPDVYGSTTTTYSFAAQASGAFTDAGGTTCRARRQPATYRYNYTYTVTSTLVDASFSINGLHGTTTNITAPGTYTISPRFAGNETVSTGALSYGLGVSAGIDEDQLAPLFEEPLGSSYSTTATGPNPSGTVTVTIADGVIDVPGTRITFDDPVTADVFYTTGSGLIRLASNLFISPNLRATQGTPWVLEPGVAYTFNQTAHASGRRLSAITCTGATPTLDAANNRFSLAALPDRGTASCQLTHSFAPIISSVAPATGPAAGGTVVTITGDAFSDVTAVRFGGVAATSFTINSATQITATAPAGTGTVDVLAFVGALSNTNTAADDFAYLPAPTVTGLSPASGARTGGTSVVVTGADLTGATGVTFGGVAATAFTVDSATQITATAPAGAANGPVDVQVTAPGGVSANTAADDFTYLTAPTVTGLSPTSGALAGGTAVTLTGTDFTGATAVAFGAASAVFTVDSATQITATAPAGAAGTVNVTVTTSGGASATAGAGDDFTYIAPPQILGGSGNGPESGGVTANYIGTGFTGATAVHFGANAAPSFNVISDTQISVVTPAGTGTVDVTVTTPFGVSSTAGGTNDYEYVPAPPAPVIITPVSGSATNDTTPSFSGTAFPGAGVHLYLDGSFFGVAPNDGMGNWTYTPGPFDAALSQGPHTLYARAENVGGLSVPSTTVTFTIDTTPPAAPAITSPVSGVITQAVTQVSGTGDPGTEVLVYINDGGAASGPSGAQAAPLPGYRLFGSATVDGMGSWTVFALRSDAALSAPGPQGVGETATSLYAESFDDAGNASPASNTVTLTTDSVVPVTPTVTGPTPGQTVQGGNPTFTGMAEPGSTVDVYVDGLFNGRTTANGTGDWSHTYDDAPPTAPAYPSGDGRQSGLAAGSHSMYTISRDLAGNTSTSATVTFNIVLVAIDQTTVPDGAVASAYSQTLTASGGTAPYSFAVTGGALPAGITLSAAGVLSGTPTAGGAFTFTVTVTDAASATASQAFSLTVTAPTVSSASTLTAARRGFAYSQTLTGSGGTGSYSFALQSGSLPAGITLSAAGVISGTPTVTGSFPIVVRITDSSTGSGPYFGDVSLTLVVDAAAITVTPATLPGVMAGLPYEQTLSASGGSGAYTYAVTAGALPSGIHLTSTGRLVGQSYTVGTFPFTVTATDAFGNTGSVALSLAILARPDPSQDPDVRGLDTAQAEASRRLTSVQIDNFSRRLEQLNGGGGDQGMSNGLTFNAGISNVGQQADQRTQLGGGRMFDQHRPDFDRAELDALLWSATADAGGRTGPAFGSPALGGSGPVLNAGQSGDGSSSGGFRFWTGGAVTIGERDAETGQARINVRSSGVSMGADVAVTPTLDLGIGAGFGQEGADIGRDDTAVDTTSVVGVVYGSWRPQSGVHVDAMLGYGQLEFDLQRRVAIDGSLVLGDREGDALFGSIGLGFDRPVLIGRMTAYGRIEGMNAELDAYTETGSPFWALSYAARDVESLQGVLGARYVWSHLARDSAWTPSLRLEYRHEFADGGLQSLQYADFLTGPVYQIRSSGWDRSELGLGVGLTRTGDDGWTLATEAGARVSANEASATLRLNLSRKF